MESPFQTYTKSLARHQNQFFTEFQDKLEPEKVEELLNQLLQETKQADSRGTWEKLLLKWNELCCHFQTHFALASLAFQIHTKDEAVELEERRLKEKVEPVIEKVNARIREKFLNSPEKDYLKERFGEHFFQMLQIEQDSFNPKNIELETKLNQLLADFTKLVGGAHFELNGKKYPISHYKKFSSSTDPKVRKESFLSYCAWYLNHREDLEKIYDQLVETRQQMGQNLGHKNFIPLGYQRMQRTDYGPEEVAQFREQIREVLVPVANKIRQQQAKKIGEDRLKVWNGDYFPYWQLGRLKVSIQEQPKTALGIYQKLSPKLGEYFQNMMEHQLIDVEAREGKAPGAFCTDFADYRVPFIFLNSVGESTDVTTLLHESGHAFQAWESRNIDLLELRWPGLEACEVHSMSMEFLAFPYYEEFFTEEDAEKFRQRHLADSILIMPYIAMVDEFQHLVYSGEAKGPEGRVQAWKMLEEKYVPSIDFSDAPDWQRHRWIRQLHIYQVPFYYIDYAIAQMGAWQIWMQSLKDREAAMQNYLNLCRLGGTLPLKEFFAAGKLQLPFEKGVLKKLIEEVLQVQAVY